MMFLWQAISAENVVVVLAYALWWQGLLWMMSIARGVRWWDSCKVPTVMFLLGGPAVGLLSLLMWLTSSALLSIVYTQEA